LFTYPQHTAKVKCLAWSPDSSRFATGGLDTHLVIWNPTKGTTPQTIKGRDFLLIDFFQFKMVVTTWF
jgi:WD40 repeat protein